MKIIQSLEYGGQVFLYPNQFCLRRGEAGFALLIEQNKDIHWRIRSAFNGTANNYLRQVDREEVKINYKN